MHEQYSLLAVILITLAAILWVLIAAVIITIIHEAGHAIAIVLLTKEKVSVYLGSHGNIEGSRMITAGRYEFWIIKNILKWKGGLCVPHATEVSDTKRLIYIVAGPITGLILGSVTLCALLLLKPEGLVVPFLILFCIVAFSSFLYNIVPSSNAIISHKGSISYNDGSHIKAILDARKIPSEFDEAATLFDDGKYEEAAKILETLIVKGTRNAEIYRLCVFANIKARNYIKADAVQKQQIAKLGDLNTHDRINLALLKTLLGKYDEAIAYYKHLLQSDKNNKYNLSNLGYTYTIVDRYEEAIQCLDKAISIDSQWYYPYSSRGFAKLKLGQLEEGKQDIDFAMELEGNYSNSYRNLGIYYYEMGQYADAMANFEKAKALDPETQLLDRYTIDTHNRLLS